MMRYQSAFWALSLLTLSLFSETSTFDTGALASSRASELSDKIWFPSETKLFPLLKADPRQVRMSAGVRAYDHTFNTQVASANFGGDVSVIKRGKLGPFDEWQLGIQGGVWGIFDFRSRSFDFLNSDWYGGIPLYARSGDVSWRFRFYHISSHLGDEWLVEHGTEGRVNPSMECFDVTAYLPLFKERFDNKLFGYGSLGLVLASDKTFPRQHLYCNAGVEYYFDNHLFPSSGLKMMPYIAANVSSWEINHYAAGKNLALGLSWADENSSMYKLHTQLEYYSGHTHDGQFGLSSSKYVIFQIIYEP